VLSGWHWVPRLNAELTVGWPATAEQLTLDATHAQPETADRRMPEPLHESVFKTALSFAVDAAAARYFISPAGVYNPRLQARRSKEAPMTTCPLR
jgi:hypothetical protein